MTDDWLLLLYFLPARHAPARVQAWRRLQRLGAINLKNSVYVLPHTAEAREDFEWIKREVLAGGGQATVLIARTPDQAVHDEIVDAFRAARAQEYGALETAASALLRRRAAAKRSKRQHPQAVRRLREQFEETTRRDFFGAPERDRVAELLARLDARPGKAGTMAKNAAHLLKPRDYRAKTWLTRPRPGVDRMSSAWLIRRFIDPDAKFVFGGEAKTPGAIPFDTFEAEFGHDGAHCTFETLCARFGIADPRARWIGRIVHDLDLKEETYREAEAATVGRLVEGLRRSYADDQALLGMGIATFEALYQSTADKKRPSPTARSRRRLA
jgi:hypothetical protein